MHAYSLNYKKIDWDTYRFLADVKFLPDTLGGSRDELQALYITGGIHKASPFLIVRVWAQIIHVPGGLSEVARLPTDK